MSSLIDAGSRGLIVYGTVIAWHGEWAFADASPARNWEVHHLEAARQAAEWVELARRHPSVPIAFAGDFN